MAQLEFIHEFNYVPAKIQKTQYFNRVINRKANAKDIRMVIQAAEATVYPPAHRHNFLDITKDKLGPELIRHILGIYFPAYELERDPVRHWEKDVRSRIKNSTPDIRICSKCQNWSSAVTWVRQRIKAEIRKAQNIQAVLNSLPKNINRVDRAEHLLRYDLTHTHSNSLLGFAAVLLKPKGEVKTETIGGAACYGTWPNVQANADTDGSTLERYVEDSLRHSRAHWEWKSWPFQDYLHWVLNHSPYAQAFVTKDAEEVFHDGWVANLDMSGRYMAGAGKSIRIIDEWPNRLLFWRAMRDKIPPRLLSFLMQATHFRFEGVNKNYNRWKYFIEDGCDFDNPTITSWHQFTTWESGHSVFDVRLSQGGLRRYLQGAPLKEAFDPPFRENMNYRGQMRIWGKTDLTLHFQSPNNEHDQIKFPSPGEAGTTAATGGQDGVYVHYDPTRTDEWIKVFAKLNNLEGYVE